MLERLGIQASDRRNLRIVVGVMFVVMLVLVEGPILVRAVAAAIFGLVSGVCFLAVTLLLDRVGST